MSHEAQTGECVPPALLATSEASAHSTPPGDTASAENTRAVKKEGTAQGGILPESSVFARVEKPVHNVPMSVIHRPLPSELDEDKVKRFMEEMKTGDTFTPIEIIKVRAPLKSNPTAPPSNFYFSMGGCHRYEATKRLGLETIRARIIEVPASQMRVYLGAGSPF